jgi:hydrogenase maturation protein HypF
VNSRRFRLSIDGTVQGVGFRPYVFRLAHALELNGFVRNDAAGVVIEVEGPARLLEHFIDRLPAEAPPLAVCGDIVREEIAPLGAYAFTIVESEATSPARALVTPDTATCDDCLRELFDPENRRFRYPFVNCTNCGPRFTIVRGVPYDRSLTTMANFVMCARCHAEYDDPADRRFHAQPNACPDCGPRARLVDNSGEPVSLGDAGDAVEAAAIALRGGAIIAVKGLGGYHLACRADRDDVVRRLRERKHREEKPFAIMVPDAAAARRLATVGDIDEQLLIGRERPIVLVRRLADAPVAPGVAPRQRDLGLMLPYTPLHQLLLSDAGMPLVMTSGNVSDEPIAFRDTDALARLARIADLFLVHDRPIEWRVDDSIVRVVSVAGARRSMMLRRSRGYVPAPLTLPVAAPEPLLACGGQLKNTYCLARGQQAWLGPHIGDLASHETLCSYENGVAHHERLFAVRPRRVAYDSHPEYLSTKYAVDRAEASSEIELDAVQHHHAHLAACLAEHGERGPAIGVIFDGTGYGLDGAMWGGEVLLGDLTRCERVGHLRAVRMPGGEAAVREPWRMACAWLSELSPDALPALPRLLVRRVDERAWRAVVGLARSGVASPYTTSVGRLLDAMSAVCGVRHVVSYEGQAAIELEMLADERESVWYDLQLHEIDGMLTMDARPLIRGVLRDLAALVPVSMIAARIHNSIANVAVRCCRAVAEDRGVRTVVLSGGVFQNMLLLERTASALSNAGFRVLVPERVPPNDGGIAFGQAAIAAARAAAADARGRGDATSALTLA